MGMTACVCEYEQRSSLSGTIWDRRSRVIGCCGVQVVDCKMCESQGLCCFHDRKDTRILGRRVIELDTVLTPLLLCRGLWLEW